MGIRPYSLDIHENGLGFFYLVAYRGADRRVTIARPDVFARGDDCWAEACYRINYLRGFHQ